MLAATATPMKSASVDARPIIPRNKTNLWTQAESIRDEWTGTSWRHRLGPASSRCC